MINASNLGTSQLPSMVLVNLLGGEELVKICTKSVCRTQPELWSSLLLQYTIDSSAVVNELNIKEDASSRMFER